jgi:hypothetical protein
MGRSGSLRATDVAAIDHLFGLFLGLVTGTSTTRGTDGATDHGARRPRHDCTDGRTGSTAGQRSTTRAGLVVAFGGLTCDRAGDGPDATADDGTDRSTDRHADGGSTERARAGPEGLGPAFFVLDGRAIRVDHPVAARHSVVKHVVGSRVKISIVDHLVS